MMELGQLTKQPGERFPVSVDFALRLQAGDPLVTGTVTARDRRTGADTTTLVLDGAATISGTVLTREVQAGTHGDVHVLTFRVTTAAGHIYEEDLVLFVREV
jgi:hypothetical protein